MRQRRNHSLSNIFIFSVLCESSSEDPPQNGMVSISYCGQARSGHVGSLLANSLILNHSDLGTADESDDLVTMQIIVKLVKLNG